MLTRTLAAAAILAGTSHAALAGGFAEPVFAPVAVAPVVVETPAFTWTGNRAGIVLGYGEGSGSRDDEDGDDDDDDDDFDFDIEGGYGGLRFSRYNQFGSRVIGGDATIYSAPDIDGGNIDADVVAAFRLKAGNAFGADGRTLGYVAGGLAVTSFSIGDGDNGIGGGYTVGLGVERAISDRTSIFAEVNYTDFGDIGGSKTDADFTGVNVGLNFGF